MKNFLNPSLSLVPKIFVDIIGEALLSFGSFEKASSTMLSVESLKPNKPHMFLYKEIIIQVWWITIAIPALRKVRQDCCDVKSWST